MPRLLKKPPPLALLLLRNGRETLLPNDDFALADGDELLFAGRSRGRRRMTITLHNPRVLHYVCTGLEAPRGVWREVGR